MNKTSIKAYIVSILISEGVGALAGILTIEGTRAYSETLIKPPLSPPAIVFPIAWAILYLLMGIGAARVWTARQGKERTLALRIYAIQLGFNFFWSIIFFNLQAYALAYVWLAALWALILVMIFAFNRVDKPAALMQIPYLLWVSFAGYLNIAVWMLNG